MLTIPHPMQYQESKRILASAIWSYIQIKGKNNVFITLFVA
jgi:hypothetical protein